MSDQGVGVNVVVATSIASIVTGFLLGVFTVRGYVISPELSAERRGWHDDPEESDESDVDEDDSLLDHAPNWTNGSAADARQGLKAGAGSTRPPVQDTGEECKLVLAVRTDLGMTKGKIAAQCSHATLACFKALSRPGPGSREHALLTRWERLGQAKIAVQVKSEDELVELRARAFSLGIAAEPIHDAGRTQIEAGSMTVLGVGPAPKSLVDQVTGHLKLL